MGPGLSLKRTTITSWEVTMIKLFLSLLKKKLRTSLTISDDMRELIANYYYVYLN